MVERIFNAIELEYDLEVIPVCILSLSQYE